MKWTKEDYVSAMVQMCNEKNREYLRMADDAIEGYQKRKHPEDRERTIDELKNLADYLHDVAETAEKLQQKHDVILELSDVYEGDSVPPAVLYV